MQAFNPTAPAIETIEAGLGVEDLHQSLYRNLAARADLEPGSQQLLVGGVGSGKTTELLLARRWLEAQNHSLPLYIDVSKATDLGGLNSGSLLASLGLRLAARITNDLNDYWRNTSVSAELRKAFAELWSYAYGKTERVRVVEADDTIDDDDIPDWEDEGEYYIVEHPGKLRPPLPSLEREIRNIRDPLVAFLSYLRKKQNDNDIVVVFDGLDRLIDATKFWSVVHQDLRLLRELRVSVLATAPLSAPSLGRALVSQFPITSIESTIFQLFSPILRTLRCDLCSRNGERPSCSAWKGRT